MVDEDRAAEQTRVADLSKRIAEFEIRQQEERRYRKAKLPNGGMALAGRVTTELVAGVVVGTFIGWAFDNWLGTTPTLMVVFFFLGSAAGMMNVWRALTGRGMAAGFVNEKSSQADENKANELMNGRD
ncbi:MAG: AtpZ/AtpI family protein [Candidatus Puniceispirillaceae bacterium]